MKQLILAVVIVVALPIISLTNSYLLTERCDALLATLDSDQIDDRYSDMINEEWSLLKSAAAYSTPYDLIRTANNACEGYLTRLKCGENSAETEAALVQFRSAIYDLRRIHAFSLELVF